jgi:hypothetical protein
MVSAAKTHLFTNYFLLSNNNKDYFEKALSVIPKNDKRIIWDEYYKYKQDANTGQNEPSPFRVLFSYPAFRAAFLLAIILIALWVLLNMKRAQRIIPPFKKNTNESLDFVKTIGRLYYDKKNHLNLAGKMATYFLEHVRSKYFISTSELNEEFIQRLGNKSGYGEDNIRSLTNAVIDIQNATSLSEIQLNNYYKQFSKFYKYTT